MAYWRMEGKQKRSQYGKKLNWFADAAFLKKKLNNVVRNADQTKQM